MGSLSRAGVLTFHRCINYGSYWQARCLVEAIRARGFNVELLDYTEPLADLRELRCALQPTLPIPTPPADRPLYRAKVEAFQRAQQKLPCSPRFSLYDSPPARDYDVVVVGSDEVWNLCHPWFGGAPLFFGAGIQARKIGYAATFGNVRAEGRLGEPWEDRLRRFDAISVRDVNSVEILRRSLQVDADIVLDPCLLHPQGIESDSIRQGPEGPCIAVYGHNFSARFIEGVCQAARALGLPLVSIGYRNDWADCQWLTAGPGEFAAFISRAAAVATNFFHGCVFSLLNERPFVCEVSPYRFVKVRGLLSLVSGEAHLAGEETRSEEYAVRLSMPPGTQSLARIESLRRASAAWLDRALGPA